MSGLGVLGRLVLVLGKGLALLGLVVALSACATMGPRVEIVSTFDAASAAYIHKKGKAKISGQAFIRVKGNKSHKSVAGDVILIPRTAYADERFAAIYGNRKSNIRRVNLEDADPEYEKYMRTTISNTVGRFEFKNVADGDYYLIAEIFFSSGYSERGYMVMDRITVSDGENLKVILRGY